MYQVIGSIDNGDDILEWEVYKTNSRPIAKQMANKINEWAKENHCLGQPNLNLLNCPFDNNFRQGLDGVVYYFRKVT